MLSSNAHFSLPFDSSIPHVHAMVRNDEQVTVCRTDIYNIWIPIPGKEKERQEEERRLQEDDTKGLFCQS